MQNPEEIDKIVIHHSASALTTTAKEIKQWHLDRGWKNIGYHYVIEFNGAVRAGRPLTVVPAAQKGANTNSIAICVVGDNTDPNKRWLPAQWRSLENLIQSLYVVLVRRIPVSGHRDVLPGHTECPGLDIKELLRNREDILIQE
jgi:N-acetyl-anhydromuramyl-L-alanine amidase AmpD